MKNLLIVVLSCMGFLPAASQEWKEDAARVKENIYGNYEGMFREEGGGLKYPFITPGSSQYADVLWDWDSWLTNIALRQILLLLGLRRHGRMDSHQHQAE